MSDEQRARIRLLAAEGWSVRAIARELDLSKSAVHRVLMAAVEPEPEPEDYEPEPDEDDDDSDWPDEDDWRDADRPEPPALVEPVAYCGEEWQILPRARGEERRRVRVERWTDARGQLCTDLTFYRHRQRLRMAAMEAGVRDYDRDAREFMERLDAARAEYEQRRSIAGVAGRRRASRRTSRRMSRRGYGEEVDAQPPHPGDEW